MEYELTIVIPVYNRAGIVGRTLESVQRQTLRPLRVVLVDNNSTDATPEVLRAWKEHAEGPGLEIILIDESRAGAAAARARGLREVTTSYTMFFDSDDLMAPSHAARALKALKQTGADIVGWDVDFISHRGKPERRRFYESDTLWHTLMHGSMATQRHAARTDLFRRAGNWDAADHGWDDIELGTRMLLLAPSVKKINGPVTVTVIGLKESITGEAFSPNARNWEESLDRIERSLAAAGRPTEAVRLRRAHLAGLYSAEGSAEEALRLMLATLSAEPSALRRTLLRFACRYTSLGGRGVARLLRPFFKI